MAQDLAHWYGNDLTASASGDLLAIDEPVLTEQALVRRLLTNPGDYIWHPTYGAGLAQYVGRPAGAKTVQAIVRAQLKLESAVASDPAPTVTVAAYPSGAFAVSITYWNNNSGSSRTVAFDVNK